jgi:tRNA threonylcarbamoyladenosine biosynthesis protein TsaB
VSEAPLLLAIDSATARASAALLRGDAVLAHCEGPVGRHHSETLLPRLDGLLRDQGAVLADVDAFAVSIGPGAFTSLRIGLATVKGLAFGTDRPVVAVSTLEALAHCALERTPVDASATLVATLDARRGEVYAAAWRVVDLIEGNTEAAVVEPGVYRPETLSAQLPPDARGVGEGVSILAASADFASRFALEGPPYSRPHATAVGRIGIRERARGRGGPAADLLPRYLRGPQAEPQRPAGGRSAGPGSRPAS